uniref:Predicted protein n=1 Tax=Hordeum vulgare subsp. vulgare TaxID=112509 RepID=F2D8D6_HORVV|nr:predicted protein [Hordeum vulgare subsp. vulgare]
MRRQGTASPHGLVAHCLELPLHRSVCPAAGFVDCSARHGSVPRSVCPVARCTREQLGCGFDLSAPSLDACESSWAAG